MKVTAPTGTAVANAQALWRELNKLRDRTIRVNTHFTVTGTGEARNAARPRPGHYAAGGPVRRYATGGPVQGFPSGGAVFGAGQHFRQHPRDALERRVRHPRRCRPPVRDAAVRLAQPDVGAATRPNVPRAVPGPGRGRGGTGPQVTYNVYPANPSSTPPICGCYSGRRRPAPGWGGRDRCPSSPRPGWSSSPGPRAEHRLHLRHLLRPRWRVWPLTSRQLGWYTLADGVSGGGAPELTTDPHPRAGRGCVTRSPWPGRSCGPCTSTGTRTWSSWTGGGRWRAPSRAPCARGRGPGDRPP